MLKGRSARGTSEVTTTNRIVCPHGNVCELRMETTREGNAFKFKVTELICKACLSAAAGLVFKGENR